MVYSFKFIPYASPKLLNLNQGHPSRKVFILVNTYKIEFMITSLIEMLELLDFGHMTTSTISLESRGKILLVASWTEIMTSWPLF